MLSACLNKTTSLSSLLRHSSALTGSSRRVVMPLSPVLTGLLAACGGGGNLTDNSTDLLEVPNVILTEIYEDSASDGVAGSANGTIKRRLTMRRKPVIVLL